LPANESHPIRVKITVHPEPIKVAYHEVLKVVPQLLGPNGKPFDILLHIGMAARRNYYTLERRSFRDHYDKLKDVDGRIFSSEEGGKLWSNCPEQLHSTFKSDDVWRRWRAALPAKRQYLDLRPSDDPGNFLCGFIYYSSLAYFYEKKEKERQIMFLHVPDMPTERDVDDGREVTIALIRALAESRQHYQDRQDGLENISIQRKAREDLHAVMNGGKYH